MIIVLLLLLLLLLLLSIWVADFGDFCHRWNSWERCGLEGICICILLQVSILVEGYKCLWATASRASIWNLGYVHSPNKGPRQTFRPGSQQFHWISY
jgi:hypothetical protein